jgi:hypothetical protein
MVSDKTFLKEISASIYGCHYEDTQLLHISGGHGFFFDPSDHQKEEVDERTFLFSNRNTKETFVMHRIRKENAEADKVIRQYLENFRLKNDRE